MLHDSQHLLVRIPAKVSAIWLQFQPTQDASDLKPKEQSTEQIPYVSYPRGGSPLLQQPHPNKGYEAGCPCERLHTAPGQACQQGDNQYLQ